MTTTPTYLDSVSVQLYLNGGWVDISQYVVEDINADWGILNNSPTDRIGYVGGMTIKLNNNSGIFTPNTVNTLNGWKIGVKVRLVLTFGGESYVRFKGRVKRIGLSYKVNEITIVPVHVVDWFDEAINTKIFLQQIESNVNTADAVITLLNLTPTPPDNTDIDDGEDILKAVFTTADTKSTVYSELSKLALSEFAFIYLKKDKIHGETLRVEKRQSRIAKNVSTSLVFNNMYEMETDFGENLINELTVRNNPVRVDDTLQVLFSLDEPIEIGAGQTLPDMMVTYKDPTGGGLRINGTNLQTPVINTDYKMWSNRNGTGTDLTSNLSFTVEFGTSGAIIRSLTNTGDTTGFITKLDLRGYGVYTDNPIELFFEDTPSISNYGIAPFTYNNHYQSNINISKAIGKLVLSQNKENQIIPREIKLIANISPDMMNAFLNLDVGDLIQIQHNEHNINGKYFIHSVNFRIYQGGKIEFKWGLTDAYLADKVYWILGRVNYSELGTTTIVSF
ncbi:MAG: hypothetical protein HRF47_12250 [Chloroflexota bacterium]|jgi:hypothetical protein